MNGLNLKTIAGKGTPQHLTLQVRGEMTIEHADELRDGMNEVFASAESVCFDLSKVTAVDLSGLQLLCAAHRTSILLQKKFTVAGVDRQELAAMASAAGYFRDTGCDEDKDKTCVWLGGTC